MKRHGWVYSGIWKSVYLTCLASDGCQPKTQLSIYFNPSKDIAINHKIISYLDCVWDKHRKITRGDLSRTRICCSVIHINECAFVGNTKRYISWLNYIINAYLAVDWCVLFKVWCLSHLRSRLWKAQNFWIDKMQFIAYSSYYNIKIL